MKFKDYIKDRLSFLVINFCIFFFLSAIMLVIKIEFLIVFLMFFIWFTPIISYMLIQYFREKQFLEELTSLSQSLDKKYLLSEVIDKPNFLEGKIYYKALKETNKSMLEQVNEYKAEQKEYREYVETWVHEIKTPIASARLIIDNHKNQVTRAINTELTRIDDYVEQALYYAKSNTANEDYKIIKCSLEQLTKKVITRNSSDLIRKNFSVDISKVEGFIYSDPKWVEFILNQIIANAIKYCNENERKLKIFTTAEKNCTFISVEDNGLGIPIQDQRKVFDKGFTGENGRRFGKSTGIGLYLCKKLCTRLGIGITLQSETGKGTTVRLAFPTGNFNNTTNSSC